VNAGGGFRTHDLQIMSIALFGEAGTLGQAELPRHSTRESLMQLNDLLKIIFFNVVRKLMSFDDKDKQIQKKIDWIASQIRETKFELHRQHQELEDALKEQEELRRKKAKAKK